MGAAEDHSRTTIGEDGLPIVCAYCQNIMSMIPKTFVRDHDGEFYHVECWKEKLS